MNSINMFAIFFLINFITCDTLLDCVKKHCREPVMICSMSITSLTINETLDPACTDTIFEVYFHNLEISNLDSLGFLNQLKHLTYIFIVGSDKINITHPRIYENASYIRELNSKFLKPEMDLQTVNQSRIFMNIEYVSVKECNGILKHYHVNDYSEVNKTTVGFSSFFLLDMLPLTDNFEECVRLFCEFPKKIFECGSKHGSHSIHQVDPIYSNCLKTVTLLRLPDVVTDIKDNALDQFESVIKIEFYGNNSLFLPPCFFSKLKHLRFINFIQTTMPSMINACVDFFKSNSKLQKITHKHFKIYRNCNQVQIINFQTLKLSIVQLNDVECLTDSTNFKYVSIIWVIILTALIVCSFSIIKVFM